MIAVNTLLNVCIPPSSKLLSIPKLRYVLLNKKPKVSVQALIAKHLDNSNENIIFFNGIGSLKIVQILIFGLVEKLSLVLDLFLKLLLILDLVVKLSLVLDLILKLSRL